MKKTYFLLALSLMANLYLYFNNSSLKNTISELNEGALTDYKYVNKMNEYSLSLYDMFQITNKINAGLLKNTISDKELIELVNQMEVQATKSATLEQEVGNMKNKRSELFSTFKYAKVYKPNE
jgi:hypothetical protein